MLMYVLVLSAPGLGLEERAHFITTYLASFDQAIVMIAGFVALLGCAAGWLPGSQPGLLQRVTAALLALAGYGFGRWLLVLVLGHTRFGYLTVQLLPALGDDVTWTQGTALIAFLMVTCIMLPFSLVSSRINRLFNT